MTIDSRSLLALFSALLTLFPGCLSGCSEITAGRVSEIEARKLGSTTKLGVEFAHSVGGSDSVVMIPPGAFGNTTGQAIPLKISAFKNLHLTWNGTSGEITSDPVPAINAFYAGSLGLDASKENQIGALIAAQMQFDRDVLNRLDQYVQMYAGPFALTAQQGFQNRANQQQAASTQPTGPSKTEQGLDLLLDPRFQALLDKLIAMRTPAPK